MEPYTTLHIGLQGGKFDFANRLFMSIPRAWQSAVHLPQDFRELIPEFFYFPDFLINENELDLGILQREKIVVNDVELPPWAQNARHFVQINRMALESVITATKLSDWIDLIWGSKSRLPLAKSANNLFHYNFYETCMEGIPENELGILKEFVACFGSAPMPLFPNGSPRRIQPPYLFRQLFSTTRRINALDNFYISTSRIVALSYEPLTRAILTVDNRLNFSRLSLHSNEIIRGRFLASLPKELSHISESSLKVALSNNRAIVALPWGCAFHVFSISSGLIQPEFVNRAHWINHCCCIVW
jgi:hypothetical protein